MTESQPPDNSRQQYGQSANDNSQINIGEQTNNYYSPAPTPPAPPAPSAPRDRAEKILLKAVKTEVAGRQEYALHNRVYIELDKQEDPTTITQPWEYDVKEGSADAVRCPPETRIVEIFDRESIGGRLLLLGAPGSGKTTMLLQLAEELVRRAVADGEQPVPVLLNLSAWKSEFKEIREWMVADLKLKYCVSKEKAEEWIENRRILPLLDGLDELMSERQETCVRALNDFLAEDWVGSPLVVCSRREEYEIYETNLGLNGSVTLLPLSDGQIERYLRQAGCAWLWDAVQGDAGVMDLVQSPLMLTILVLASEGLQGVELERWLGEESVVERRRLLFDAYIDRRLKRPFVGGLNLPVARGKDKLPKKPYRDEAKVRQWLGWVARRFREVDQTEIFIEKLQPICLDADGTLSLYSLIFGLLGGVMFGLLGGVITGSIFGLEIGYRVSLLVFIFFSVIVWLIVWLGDFNGDIAVVETIGFNWRDAPQKIQRNLRGNLLYGLSYGLLYGMSIALAVGMVVRPTHGISLGVAIGVNGGLCLGLLAGVIQAFIGVEITTKESDNQGVFRSMKNSFIFGLMSVPFGLVFPILLYRSIPGLDLSLKVLLTQGVACGFLCGAYNGGLQGAIDHLSLRTTLWLFGYSPWNYSRFLRYCTERGFLQRVGGGYRFVHALLRDHFADTEPCPGDPSAPNPR